MMPVKWNRAHNEGYLYAGNLPRAVVNAGNYYHSRGAGNAF